MERDLESGLEMSSMVENLPSIPKTLVFTSNTKRKRQGGKRKERGWGRESRLGSRSKKRYRHYC